MKCEFCSNQEIEDEEHFLFRCEFNKELRREFMQKLKDGSNEADFDESNVQLLWENIFEKRPRQSSRYVILAFENRRNRLYKRR